MTFNLRSATDEDRAAIENLVFGVLAEYGLAPDPESTDADIHDIHGEYFAKGGSFAVLVNESGHVVGLVGLYATSHSLRNPKDVPRIACPWPGAWKAAA